MDMITGEIAKSFIQVIAVGISTLVGSGITYVFVQVRKNARMCNKNKLDLNQAHAKIRAIESKLKITEGATDANNDHTIFERKGF